MQACSWDWVSQASVSASFALKSSRQIPFQGQACAYLHHKSLSQQATAVEGGKGVCAGTDVELQHNIGAVSVRTARIDMLCLEDFAFAQDI